MWRSDSIAIETVELDKEPSIDFEHAFAVDDGDIQFMKSILLAIHNTLL